MLWLPVHVEVSKITKKKYCTTQGPDCAKSEINNSFNLLSANRSPIFTQNRARLVARGTSATRWAISTRVRQRDDNFAIGLCASIMRVSLLIVQGVILPSDQVNAPYFVLVVRERDQRQDGNTHCARVSNRITKDRDRVWACDRVHPRSLNHRGFSDHEMIVKYLSSDT